MTGPVSGKRKHSGTRFNLGGSNKQGLYLARGWPCLCHCPGAPLAAGPVSQAGINLMTIDASTAPKMPAQALQLGRTQAFFLAGADHFSSTKNGLVTAGMSKLPELPKAGLCPN